ncbi:MAG: class I SAM-dependent methyltransferase [Betaproteobacteria bacterium]
MMRRATHRRALLDAASAPYRAASHFAWRFARGKLGGDPAFWAMLERGLIPDGERLLDLGCGQGLLAAWLLAARGRHDAGVWPDGFPPPPALQSLHGVELMPSDVARGRTALGPRAFFTQGDIRFTEFGRAHAIVILDVLHYIDYADQDAVLARVREALPPGGVLLLRIGDADGGLRFRISQWVDHVVTYVRGHRMPRLHCRPLAEWKTVLARLGFRLDALPMSSGTPFSNVLLVGRKLKT